MTDFIKFLEDLNESQSEIEKAAEDIKANWYKRFPGSLIYINTEQLKFRKQSWEYSFHGKCYLLHDKNEWPNGSSHNDPLALSFIITGYEDKVTVKYFEGAALYVNPENKYLAFSTKKIPVRKTTSKTLNDAVKKLAKVFDKTKDVVKQAVKNGELNVHGEKIAKIIEKRVK